MPSKILRDEEGNEYQTLGPVSVDGSYWVRAVPKPEPMLEEKIGTWRKKSQDTEELCRIIIAEVGRIYGLSPSKNSDS